MTFNLANQRWSLPPDRSACIACSIESRNLRRLTLSLHKSCLMPATSLYGASLCDVFCERVDTLFPFKMQQTAKHRLQKNKMTKLALIGSAFEVNLLERNVCSLVAGNFKSCWLKKRRLSTTIEASNSCASYMTILTPAPKTLKKCVLEI